MNSPSIVRGISLKLWLAFCAAILVSTVPVSARLAPPPPPPPPVTTITSPAAGAAISGDDCGGPAAVAVSFTATSSSSVITSFTATLDGSALGFTASGIGTASAGGTAPLTFATTGTHTLIVTATDANNNTSAAATATFTVTIAAPPPPAVSVSLPGGSTYTYTTGNPPLSINAVVSATAGSGNITALSAVLVNPDSSQTPISLSTTGVGTSGTAAGNASLVLSAGGQYSIQVTATDGCGTAVGNATFTIDVVTIYPPPTAGVALPGGAVYTRVDCGGPASVLVNFTGASSALPITSLTATLDGSPIAFTPAGLGTETATGSASLGVSAAGLHSIVVTTTDSNGGTASGNATFTVNVTTSPPPGVTVTPTDGSLFTYTTGNPPLAINVSVGATAGFGNITALTAVLVNPDSSQTPISLTTTGVGSSGIASGTATLNLSAGGQYSIQVTATDGCNTSNVAAGFTINVITVYPPPTASAVLPNGTAYTRVDCGGPAPVPVNFTGASTALPINSLTATLDGSAIAFAPVGLGSETATGSATLNVSTAGLHTIVVTATDTNGGTATGTTYFSLDVTTAPPPAVSISSPLSGSTYTYTTGNPALNVPVSIGATAGFGNITALSAILVNPDSSQTSIALSTTGVGGSSSATGSANLSLSTGGQYTLNVVTADGCNSSTATTSFTINVVTIYPPPSSSVVFPGGSVYTRVDCGGPASIAANFTGSSAALPITALTATLDGSPITFAPSGIGTGTATGSATLSVSSAGLHTVVVTTTDSHGGTATSTSTFTVNVTTAPPPVVSISSPVSGSNFTYSGSPLNIPLSFSATAAFGTITALNATLDGAPITITAGGLNTASASGRATLNPSACSQHVIVVTATDSCGATATASSSFTVKPPALVCIQGCVFFDVNCNGCQDKCEPGICGATVTLCNSQLKPIATTRCASDGSYSFNEPPGTYLVCVSTPNGLSPTNNCQHGVTLTTTCYTCPPTGFFHCWKQVKCFTSSACDTDYWKCNIDKAISCNPRGAQICASKIQAYTCTVSGLALNCFSGLTEAKASCILGSTSCNPKDKLAAQLLAAEYNYVSGCYINNDPEFTYLFIYWGECVLQSADTCGTSEVNFCENWCAAYNQTQGGGYVCGQCP